MCCVLLYGILCWTDSLIFYITSFDTKTFFGFFSGFIVFLLLVGVFLVSFIVGDLCAFCFVVCFCCAFCLFVWFFGGYFFK